MNWSKLRLNMLLDANHWRRALYTARDSLWRPMDWEAALEHMPVSHSAPALNGCGELESAARPLRILYVASKYDYGNPRRGLSFEHNNFFHSLHSLGHQIFHFDFIELLRQYGRQRMNRLLREAAYRFDPDLMFTVLFKDELDSNVVAEISAHCRTITLNWFCDDHWRFEQYSRHWAPMFNWVVTTAGSCVSKYRKIGYRNAIRSQWACDHFLYRRLQLPFLYDVSFVGQPHGRRGKIIDTLRRAGLSVHTWGYGWPNGRVSLVEMIRIFNQSRVNLNLSNSSVLGQEQIKGRDFEVPGCGAFLITGAVEGIDEYFDVGDEIVCYRDIDHLVRLVRHYLRHEDERRAIAERGYQRVLRDHTYQRRFGAIFRTLGLDGALSRDEDPAYSGVL